MKRIIIICLMLILVLSIFGCKEDTTAGLQPAQTADNGNKDTKTTDTAQTTKGNPDMDLNLEKATWSSIYPEKGSITELKITVKNTGKEQIDSFDYNVRVTKDGTEWKDETKTYDEILYPGNKTKIELQYTFTSEGKYEAEIYLDKDNSLNEGNRFNNVAITEPDANVIEATSTADLNPPSDNSGDAGSTASTTTATGSGSCTDTDGGPDVTVRGECDDGVSVFGINDYCKDSTTLVEFFCASDDRCNTVEMDCSSCESGVCV